VSLKYISHPLHLELRPSFTNIKYDESVNLDKVTSKKMHNIQQKKTHEMFIEQPKRLESQRMLGHS
jgi:hypothetical protein